MKTIELLVLDKENAELGVAAISLVAEPAIEQNFYFFGAEQFVYPSKGEHQDEFLSRCIAEVIKDGTATDPSQAAAICYSMWDEKHAAMGIDTSGLTPYVDQVTKKKKKTYAEIISELVPKEHIMTEVDLTDDDLAALTYLALADEGKVPYDWTIMFRYEGEGPERTFCDHYWQQELSLADIFFMDSENSEFGPGGDSSYDKFLYKGGPNCKHYWKASSIFLRYKDRDETVDFSEAKHGDLLKEELDIYGYSSADFELSKTPMYDQANHGYLTKHSKYAFVNEDKRTVAGPIMIPDIKILRKDEETNKLYQVFFSSETIKALSEKYMKELKINNSNEQHDGAKPVDITMLESWIIEDPKHDKSSTYGFDLPAGTWFGSFKINSDDVWAKVKDGTFKGFSIEGNFQEKEA